MTRSATTLAALCVPALLLAACDSPAPAPADTPPPPPARAAPPPETGPVGDTSAASSTEGKIAVRSRSIDWDGARADLAPSVSRGAVSPQSVGQPAAKVPVLVPGRNAIARSAPPPGELVTTQSAGSEPIIRQTDDGYFAFYPGAAYNVTINGTNQYVETDEIERTNPDREPKFSVTMAGAQVWLTRYGADYLIEFECNILEEGTDTCIDEATAMDMADRLIVVESQ